MAECVIAKYLRLSIEDAKTDSLSIENQHRLLDRYIAEMDILGAVVKEFVDNGYSGTNFERPAIQELLELVRLGQVNCIIVKDFSRFGRNMIENGYYIERVFPLYGVRFIAVSDAYDSAEHEGSTGGLDVAFKFLIHEQYSRDLSQKIKSAKREKALRGESVTKNCAFGFKKVDGRLEIDEPAAETVRLIFGLHNEGHGLTEIAARLCKDKRPTPGEHKRRTNNPNCLWNPAHIHSILRDEQYIGTYIAGKTKSLEVGSRNPVKVDESEWIKIPDHHPAIVEKAVFHAVRERLGQRRTPQRRRKLGTGQRVDSALDGVRTKIAALPSEDDNPWRQAGEDAQAKRLLYEKFVRGEIDVEAYRAESAEVARSK